MMRGRRGTACGAQAAFFVGAVLVVLGGRPSAGVASAVLMLAVIGAAWVLALKAGFAALRRLAEPHETAAHSDERGEAASMMMMMMMAKSIFFLGPQGLLSLLLGGVPEIEKILRRAGKTQQRPDPLR